MTKQQIKNILNDYQGAKMRAEYVKSTSSDYKNAVEYKNFEHLCKAVEVLPQTLQTLIEKIFIENWSVRACEKEYHYCRNTITKMVDQAIEMIASCM
jgi:hypothetical protein